MTHREEVVAELNSHLSAARAEELTALLNTEAQALLTQDSHQFSVSLVEGAVDIEAMYKTLPDGTGSLTLTTKGDSEPVVLAREHASVLDSEGDASNLLTQAFVVALTHWAVRQQKTGQA